MSRREYTTDRHGVAVMDRPPGEVFADEPETCPICNGRGFTWEMDMDDPDGGGYPETCPVAAQTPELHGQPPVTAAVWCDYTEDREERWRVTITCGDRWQITGAVTTLRCRPGEVARDLRARYEPVDYERRSR